MIAYDVEYSLLAHFEMTEEEATEHGGVNFDTLKNSINKLTDYILAGIYDQIALGENDFIALNPIERTLMVDDEEIDLDEEDENITSEVEEIINRNKETNDGIEN